MKFIAVVACAVMANAAVAQVVYDEDLVVQQVATSLGSQFGELTTAFAFIDDDTALIVNRADGVVRRLDLIAEQVVEPGPTVLDLDVVSPESDTSSEYGVQSLALHPGFEKNGYVYIRYDRSPAVGVDTLQSTLIFPGGGQAASSPTTNAIERYVWNPAGNGGDGSLDLDMVIHEVTMDTRYHHGGPIVFGNDGLLYTIYGELRRLNFGGWNAKTAGPLLPANVSGGVVDNLAVVIRLCDDGAIPADPHFDQSDPKVPVGSDAWYAYGVRNSFGLEVDPVTGVIWDTQNGEASFDEINRVVPGMNGGWRHIMGPVNHPDQSGTLKQLQMIPGSTYVDPTFSWRTPLGVTGIHMLHGSRLGAAYDDIMLVGTFNIGYLWSFTLNAGRDGLTFTHPELQDGVDDRINPYVDPVGSEVEEIVIANLGLGLIAVERGEDGWPYLLSVNGSLYRLRLTPVPGDVNDDGQVNTEDLLAMLGLWGACPSPCPADLDDDNLVGIADLLLLLGLWTG